MRELRLQPELATTVYTRDAGNQLTEEIAAAVPAVAPAIRALAHHIESERDGLRHTEACHHAWGARARATEE